MTLLFLVNPSIFAAAFEKSQFSEDLIPQSWQDWRIPRIFFSKLRISRFVLHLPFISLITHILYTLCLIDLNKQRQHCEDYLKRSHSKDSKTSQYRREEKSKLELKINRLKTELQRFKIYEAFGESAPQFVLQMTIVIKRSMETSFSDVLFDRPLTAVQLGSSLLAVILSVSSLTMEMPLVFCNTVVTPEKSIWYNLNTSLINLFVVTPRLLTLAVFFSSFSTETSNQWWIALVAIGLCIVFHSFLTFCPEIIPIAKNAQRNNDCNHNKLDESETMELDEKKTISSDDDSRKADRLTFELQLIGMVTAIIAPCIFINPWKKFYMRTSLTSCFGYIIITIVLVYLVDEAQNLNPLYISMYKRYCYSAFVLLPLTVVGSIGISAYVQWINFGVYLRCCAAYGNECMLRTLLGSYLRRSIDLKDAFDKTALMYATEMGRVDLLEILLENGSVTEMRNSSHDTALIIASRHDNVGIIAVLLKTGADIEAVNLDGQTPLMVAVLHLSYKAARFLVENGADADKCDSGMCT